MHVYFICNINRAYRPLCEHMRAFAYDVSAYNASICECAHSHRIACERISHASCEHSHTLFGRLPCPLCAHMRAFACDASAFASHALAFASHPLASHANARIEGELMRVRYCMCFILKRIFGMRENENHMILICRSKFITETTNINYDNGFHL